MASSSLQLHTGCSSKTAVTALPAVSCVLCTVLSTCALKFEQFLFLFYSLRISSSYRQANQQTKAKTTLLADVMTVVVVGKLYVKMLYITVYNFGKLCSLLDVSIKL